MHDSYLLRLFVFNQPKKCFEKGKKNIGFNNLLEKVIFNLVNAIIRLANNEPNNQGRGK